MIVFYGRSFWSSEAAAQPKHFLSSFFRLRRGVRGGSRKKLKGNVWVARATSGSAAEARSGLFSKVGSRKGEYFTAKQRRVAADLGYLAENRVTILRTAVMSPETLRAEEERLDAAMEDVGAEIAARGASAQEMLDFTISFSELVKNASRYFERALDSERRQLTTGVFSELVFEERCLVKYSAKDGFGALLERKRATCSPITLVSELCDIYPSVHASLQRMSGFAYVRAGK
jgi:hypothetical protein